MNQEIVGGVAAGWEPGSDLDWAYEMALKFLDAALGGPPTGVTVDIVWLDHDLGSYPSLAATWDEGVEEPWRFIRRAEDALCRLNEAVNWSGIRPSDFWAGDEDGDDDHALGLA